MDTNTPERIVYNLSEIATAAQAGNRFAASLLADFNQYGGLTRRQAEAAARGFGAAYSKPAAVAVPAPQPAEPQPAKAYGAPLVAAFAKAQAGGAQRVKLRIGSWTFRPGTRMGKLIVSCYDERTGEYVGSFDAAGFFSGRAQGKFQDMPADFQIVAQDPHAAAVAYGKRSGSCSVCSRTLTDPESVARGIGPICASKMGW